MNRYLTPLIFAIAAIYVWNYNGNNAAQQLVFPLLDRVPGYASPYRQGQLTWQICAGIAALTLVWAGVGHWRERKQAAEGEKTGS